MPDHRLLKSMLLKLIAYYWLLMIIGLYLERIVDTLFVGSLVIILINLKEFITLVHWIWHSPHKQEVKNNSYWGYIYRGIDKSIKANRQRRKQLISALSQFREGADALPDGIVVFNQDNAILWCNSAARKFLGLSWPGDRGQLLNNLIRHQQFRQYIIRGDFSQRLELPSPHNDAVLLEHRVTSYGSDLFVLMSRDVTVLTQLEQMRRKFVADVSHELKTPLTVLHGYLELIDDEDNIDPLMWRKATTAMKTQAHRMQSLVEQLLALSKIETSQQPDNEKIKLNELMALVKDDAMVLIGERPVSIEFELDDNFTIDGNEAQLLSACTNLVSNAIRYSPDGSNIKVAWRQQHNGIEFSVADDGLGIAPHHLTRLTERFYRVDQSRSNQTGGTGLGLSIVKHVLVNHQSTLEITSVEGQGSRFSFVIDQRLTAS
ncbi:MAG: phosphate regulon sensor histidine kinase PhoR [Gammaproteobacteria bacterium]|nr:phosphate regulon sensor histidine kinase PhoR [Gammaproteobacteria bacterium]